MNEEKSKTKKELEPEDLTREEDVKEEVESELEKEEISTEDKKDTVKTEKNIFRGKKISIGIGILTCALVLFFIGISNVVAKYETIVYPGASIYGEDISKLDKAKLENKLYELKDKINNKDININANSKLYNIKVKEVVLDYNIDKLVKDIINYNKDKNIFVKFITIVTNSKKEFKFNITLSEDKVKELEAKIGKETNVEAVEPKVMIEGNNITYRKGEVGYVLEENHIENNIKSRFKEMNDIDKNLDIELKYTEEKYKIALKEVEKVQSKISTYTTTYEAGGSRGNNVENAARKIDDVLLMPGEEFSYEKYIGPVVLSNGYDYATVISNGELIQGIGGGVCQVSSTLYNTTLKAGILPTERLNHSKPVNYVPRGLDATLASGSIDYKFKNTYKYPIVINTKCAGGILTIEFWSNEKAMNEIEYKPVSYVRGNFANTYLYGYDKDGKQVYKKYIDVSIYK